MKQIDRIRNMNAEELAVVIDEQFKEPCNYCNYAVKNLKPSQHKCKLGIKAWLESEVTDEQV